MSLDRNERELQRQLRALRQADEEAAPSFSHVWSRARAQARPPERRRRFALRAALPVACAVAAFFVWLQHEPPESPPAGHPAGFVSAWETPLDFLLETPGAEFLVSVPHIFVSLELDPSPFGTDSERSEP